MILQKVLDSLVDGAVSEKPMADILAWATRWAKAIPAEHAGVRRKLVQIGTLAHNVSRSEALRRTADQQRVYRELFNLRNAIHRAMTGMSDNATDSYLAQSYLSLAATQVLALPSASNTEYLIECNVLVETTGVTRRALPECAKFDPDNTGLLMVAQQQVFAVPTSLYNESATSQRLADYKLRSMYNCARVPGYRGYVFVWCCPVSARSPLDQTLQPSTVKRWLPNICSE